MSVPAAPPNDRAERTYAALVAAFCVVLVLTNIVGVKLFVLFAEGGPALILDGNPWTLTSGIITYPLTFLLTDVVSEIWGRRRANFMVGLGFVMSLLMLAIVTLAGALPPSPHWTNPELGVESAEAMQAAFDATFHFPGLLLFASMTAYLVAQLFDVRLYHFWWRRTRGGHMWLRNNASTAVSQLVDTIIVNGIFLRFGFGFEWGQIFDVIVAVYLCKLVLAAIDTPLIYAARGWLRVFLDLPRVGSPERAPLAP